ncbi:type II 3-dehydroquinate dehydratase [Pantoea sp. Aalb]|uniref:type II 3-dehydroquinate dehydratase n=1 Tax=Pantoea sp. Aalb TaxID=2576762 RepID=UPI001320AEF1|nr:type II 3-dehydroquinate dehydratase [Pantoea sp. Aalb]MXP67661.1 type II 3-dehydroquinate dehydratase [Pantoea sp. Aalb]
MKQRFHVLVLNGPNLNLLGIREPKNYGDITISKIIDNLTQKANENNVKLSHLQSNAEFQLIDRIHKGRDNVDYIIINPAAFTHTSIALRDALLAVNIPFIEIHISNVHAREPFRHYSYFSDISAGVICGIGIDGYTWALQTAIKRLSISKVNI